eukprot:m.1233015 g.1233015  ORF g.1233015 m.1233015 type:complete len:857 (+) comp24661_c2_seq35:1641-4211(+)
MRLKKLNGVAEIWRFVGEDEELINKFLVVESLQDREDVDTKLWKLARRYIVSFYIGFLNADFVYFPTPTLESNLDKDEASVIVRIKEHTCMDGLGLWIRSQRTPAVAVSMALGSTSTRVLCCTNTDERKDSIMKFAKEKYKRLIPKSELYLPSDENICLESAAFNVPTVVFVDIDWTHMKQVCVPDQGQFLFVGFIPVTKLYRTRELVKETFYGRWRLHTLHDFLTSIPYSPRDDDARCISLEAMQLPDPASVSVDDKHVQDWLRGTLQRKPFSFGTLIEVFRQHPPPMFEQAKYLAAEITKMLGKKRANNVHTIALESVVAGSGATSILLQLAIHFETNCTLKPKVLFHHNNQRSDDIASMCSQLLASDSACVLFFDTNVRQCAEECIAELAKQSKVSIVKHSAVVIVLVATRWRKGQFPITVSVNPFLEKLDARDLVAYLSRIFPSSAEALAKHCEHARTRTSGSPSWDLHIFAFALTAMQGSFVPGMDLVRGILTGVKDRPRSKDKLICMAHLSAFSRGVAWVRFPIQCSTSPKDFAADLLGKKQLESSIQDRLEHILDKNKHGFSICHPLIGLLILYAVTDCKGISLTWLEKFHSTTGRALMSAFDLTGPDEDMRKMAKVLIITRSNSPFSAILQQFDSQLVVDPGADTPQMVEDAKNTLHRLLGCKHWGLGKGYADLQYGRVLLFWSKKLKYARCVDDAELKQKWYELSEALLGQAISAARAANDALQSFDSICFLASTLGYSGKVRGKLLSSEDFKECIKLYESLYLRTREKQRSDARKQDMRLVTAVLQLFEKDDSFLWAATVAKWKERANDLKMELPLQINLSGASTDHSTAVHAFWERLFSGKAMPL